MKSGSRTKLFGLTELMLGALITVMIIMLANRYLSSVRLDMTEHKIYTLSQGTKNILGELTQPLNLKLFYSKQLSTDIPGIDVYADRVADMLREYQRLADSKISLEFIDPEPFSEAEDAAVANGLSSVAVDQQGSGFYFGLVGTNAIDGLETIAFFTPEREQQLEYDLTRLIQRLSTESSAVVGVLSSLEVNGNAQAQLYGMPSQPWFSISQLDQLYSVNHLDTNLESIDPSISVLLVIHPAGLPRQALFAIDQYALNGGKIMLFADPLPESEQAGGQGQIGAAPVLQNQQDLDELLKAWGVNFNSESLVADFQNAMRVQTNASASGEVVDYPIWFRLDQQSMNDSEPVLQQLGDVIMASSGALGQADKARTQFIPLLTTSETASLLGVQSVRLQSDPKEVMKMYQPGSESLTVAARVFGDAATAFPDYRPPEQSEESQDAGMATGGNDDTDDNLSEDPAQETENTDDIQPAIDQTESGEINAVIFADTDFLRDAFWVQIQNFLGNQLVVPTAGNGTLIANMVDQMSGSPDLISVRNRGSANRPFTLIESIRQNAEQKFLNKEQELIAELQATENTLAQLEQAKNDENSALLSSDQQNEVDRFTRKKLEIRKQLRQVRHSLQKDIESVETRVKIINIAMIPFLIILAGLMMVFLRSRRKG